MSDGVNLSISRSQLVTTLVGATMSALKGALALVLRVVALHGEQQRERLDGLAEAHVVGEHAACADVVQEPEPVEALLLVGAEGAP